MYFPKVTLSPRYLKQCHSIHKKMIWFVLKRIYWDGWRENEVFLLKSCFALYRVLSPIYNETIMCPQMVSSCLGGRITVETTQTLTVLAVVLSTSRYRCNMSAPKYSPSSDFFWLPYSLWHKSTLLALKSNFFSVSWVTLYQKLSQKKK